MKEALSKQPNNGGLLAMDQAMKSYPRGQTPHSTPQRESITNKTGSLDPSINLNKSLIIEGSKEPLKLTIDEVNATAVYLVDKFSNPLGLRFYLKVAWYVPRGTIDRLVALAFDRGSNPARYFTTLTKKEME